MFVGLGSQKRLTCSRLAKLVRIAPCVTLGNFHGFGIFKMLKNTGLIVAGIVTLATLTAAVPPVLAQQVHPVVQMQSVSDLPTHLTSSSRLYVVGNPEGIAEYQKVVAQNPNLVVVVVERTSDHETEAQFIMNTLNNSDLLRTQIVDEFTGNPDGIAAARFDFFTETGRGKMNLKSFGFVSDSEITNLYKRYRNDGGSAPTSLAEIARYMRNTAAQQKEQIITDVARQADKVRASILKLQALVNSSGYTPDGYEPSLTQRWMSRIDQASGDIKKATQVDSARAAIEGVDVEVRPYLTSVQNEVNRQRTVAALIYGSLSVAAILLLISTAYTQRLRTKASREVEATREEVDLAVRKSLELLEKSCFAAISATGLQRSEGDRLDDLNCQLLDQTTAMSRFLEVARQTLEPSRLAWLKHNMLPFGAAYVKALAEGTKSLKVTKGDRDRLLSTLNGEGDPIKVSPEDRELSYTDLLQSFNQTYSEALKLFTTLSEAEDNLNKAVLEIKTAMTALKTSLGTLAEFEDPYFTASVFQTFVLRPIEDTQSGHIAMAHKYLEENNALQGIVGHTNVAARMLGNAVTAYQVALYGCQTLVPQGNSTSANLGSQESQVATDWIGTRLTAASAELNGVVQDVPYGDVSELLIRQRETLQALNATFSEARRINDLRLGEWPETLKEREELVSSSQRSVLADLQALGFFTQGTEDGIYCEEGQSPKALLQSYRNTLAELVDLLGQGDIRAAQEREQSLRSWVESVAELVDSTERRLAEFSSAFNGLSRDVRSAEERHAELNVAEVTESSFSPHSQNQAIQASGGQDPTLSSAHQRAFIQTQQASRGSIEAERQMNSAQVLSAGATLDSAQAAVSDALSILGVIPQAVVNLRNAVANAERALETATQQLSDAIAKVDYQGVRQATKNSASELKDLLANMTGQFTYAPYEVLYELKSFSQRASTLKSQIATDMENYEEINSLIATADGRVHSADLALISARNCSFTYARVNLSTAEGSLRSYESYRDNALRLRDNEDYESALRQARNALSEVDSVAVQAQTAVAAAQAAHDAEVARIAELERLEELANQKSELQAQESLSNVSETSNTDFASFDDNSNDTSFSSFDD